MKQGCAVLLLLLTFLFAATQIPSPEQFLGYKIGTHYTPHYRIVEYYKAVAAASPSTVKLQQYGVTNEGRPLLVVYVSSTQNIGNLENIRSKNIERTAGGAKKSNSGENVAIVWLSYNVHGNEAASSEASMLTLYALVEPSNTQTKTWLQNTVVVMDPCLNPDGRDRYVMWYNSVAGKNFNPSPESREHREPWPGGRTNHYNFDLNRDWAWQTQTETQQRLALYNQWLPQVHVDFHEQGYNNPYYFAPAAEPFHEVITPFQREFQITIGRNHAKYFDEKGWLYFTKEQFDLLYPSYGDTYPIYNGSIGMTYEQGGIGAGLGVVTENGDTLTLVDRAMHHYTTGLSTIEVASKNAARLITEFEKYYRDVNNGIGDVKAYVLKMNAGDTARMTALADLLKKNNIHYFSGRGTNLQGLNYRSLKEEGFNVSPADLIVPAGQPKGALVKVLFEQSTKLSDSATYDITAWSLPYAYGLQAYATKQPITGLEEYRVSKALNTESSEPYAYVIPWTGLNAAKLTGELLQKGVKLRFITTPFASGGQNFNRGSVIVMRTGNAAIQSLFSLTRSLANDAGVRLATVSSGFVEKGLDFGSSSVVPMKRRKVVLITGEGVSSLAAGEVWHYFEQQLNYPLTLINTADVGRLNWNDYDVVIMPDGNYRFLNDKASAEALKSWINTGGHLIALEGALSNLSRLDWAIKARKSADTNSKDKDALVALRRYDDRERESLKDFTPGSIYRVELDNSHPLAFGYPSYYYTLKMDNNQYEFLKDDGWNVGVIKKDKAVSGFVGSSLLERLHNSLQFGVQNIGRGTVTYFADDVLFRSFWENGKLLFANAVFLVGQ